MADAKEMGLEQVRELLGVASDRGATEEQRLQAIRELGACWQREVALDLLVLASGAEESEAVLVALGRAIARIVCHTTQLKEFDMRDMKAAAYLSYDEELGHIQLEQT